MTKNNQQMYFTILEGGEKTLAYMSMRLPPYLDTTACCVCQESIYWLSLVQLVQAISECIAVIPQFSTHL